MKDNTVTTADGIEVYKHNIKYYADEYITNELDIDHVDQDNKQIVKITLLICYSIFQIILPNQIMQI